jgi:hypothetical protein
MTKLCSTKRAAGSVFYPATALVGNRSEHRKPFQSTRKQKLIQKHSQKMGPGSIFCSARFVGRLALVRTNGVSSGDARFTPEGPRLPRSNASGALEGRRIVPPVRCRLMVNRGVNDPPPGCDV